jgi:hypothetical protein
MYKAYLAQFTTRELEEEIENRKKKENQWRDILTTTARKGGIAGGNLGS